MKNAMFSIGLAGLTTVLLSSFGFMQKSGETQEPKKSRHIRMIKTENGKKMELDTVLTGDDVFVWNGDTVNPVKHISSFDRGGFGGMHQFDVNIDRRGGNGNGMNFRRRGAEKGGPAIRHMTPGDDMNSGRKQIIVRRRMTHSPENNSFYSDGADMKHFSPMSPMPPLPHMKMREIQPQGQIINLNDPNIISYKKKKMSGDREKIEIIRKKSDDNNSAFNFQFDDRLMAPEMPEFNWNPDGDSLRVKIIEKKKILKGKSGKEIEVKVETEENK